MCFVILPNSAFSSYNSVGDHSPHLYFWTHWHWRLKKLSKHVSRSCHVADSSDVYPSKLTTVLLFKVAASPVIQSCSLLKFSSLVLLSIYAIFLRDSFIPYSTHSLNRRLEKSCTFLVWAFFCLSLKWNYHLLLSCALYM